MRFRPFALLACVAAASLSACSEDPTEAGNLEPLAIVTNFSETTRAVGASFQIRAYAIDQNNARLTGQLTGTASSAAIRVDSMPYFPELQETFFFVTATAKTTGTTLTISGHGLSKDVTVIVP